MADACHDCAIETGDQHAPCACHPSRQHAILLEQVLQIIGHKRLRSQFADLLLVVGIEQDRAERLLRTDSRTVPLNTDVQSN